MPAAVELRGVVREHGNGPTRVVALAGVSLRVTPGELVAIMGPSGSGKSTLLNIAGGLDTPTSGAAFINGTEISNMDLKGRAQIRRKHVGYVFQDFNLIPALSAAENVRLPLELDGVSSAQAREAAQEALASVGIAHLADRFPDDMSGGQMQRVAIARALVGQRSIIMADEPTGALDSHTGEMILQVLRERIDAGTAGLLVTHEARFAAWADRTVFLRDGKIVDETASDSAADLLL